MDFVFVHFNAEHYRNVVKQFLLGLHKVVQDCNNTKFAFTCCPSGIFERQFCKGNLNVKNHIFPGNIPLAKLKNGEKLTEISVWWDRGLGNKPIVRWRLLRALPRVLHFSIPPPCSFPPPRSQPETPLFPRGPIIRQWRQELPLSNWLTDKTLATLPVRKILSRRFTCVCHCLQQELWGWRCSVSPLQCPTGYKLNSGRPVHTLRGRRLCPRGCPPTTPGDGGWHLQLNTFPKTPWSPLQEPLGS